MGSPESRVEALREQLGYPANQRDPEGSRFWFLRPGADKAEAEETCPIAVGFYSELNTLAHNEILHYLTAEEQQREIYGHYTNRLTGSVAKTFSNAIYGAVSYNSDSTNSVPQIFCNTTGWTVI